MEEGEGELLFPLGAVARDFQLIEDGMLPILIPFDRRSRRLLGKLHLPREPVA